MIASLYQRGSVALAGFFTLWFSKVFRCALCAPCPEKMRCFGAGATRKHYCVVLEQMPEAAPLPSFTRIASQQRAIEIFLRTASCSVCTGRLLPAHL
jgi:hypothetical protein